MELPAQEKQLWGAMYVYEIICICYQGQFSFGVGLYGTWYTKIKNLVKSAKSLGLVGGRAPLSSIAKPMAPVFGLLELRYFSHPHSSGAPRGILYIFL
jgi:hypothetical protein